MRNKINKYRDVILLTIGTLLVILSLCLLFYDRIELLKSNVFAEVEMEKYREQGFDDTIEEDDDNSTNTESQYSRLISSALLWIKEFLCFSTLKKSLKIFPYSS